MTNTLPSQNSTVDTDLKPEKFDIDPLNYTLTKQHGVQKIAGPSKDGTAQITVEKKTLSLGGDANDANDANNGDANYVQHTATMTKSDTNMSTDERQKVAKELSGQGLNQTEIASRLGVSQKTISNDLRS